MLLPCLGCLLWEILQNILSNIKWPINDQFSLKVISRYTVLWKVLHLCLSFICCCFSVIQLCLALCDPMDCGMPGSSVLHYIPEFAQIHVPELVMLSDHLILCHPFSFCLQSFPASGSFPVSWLFASGGQSIGASSSVLNESWMNIQDWYSLGLTSLISLLSKGLSRVFSSTTVQKHQIIIYVCIHLSILDYSELLIIAKLFSVTVYSQLLQMQLWAMNTSRTISWDIRQENGHLSLQESKTSLCKSLLC